MFANILIFLHFFCDIIYFFFSDPWVFGQRFGIIDPVSARCVKYANFIWPEHVNLRGTKCRLHGSYFKLRHYMYGHYTVDSILPTKLEYICDVLDERAGRAPETVETMKDKEIYALRASELNQMVDENLSFVRKYNKFMMVVAVTAIFSGGMVFAHLI